MDNMDVFTRFIRLECWMMLMVYDGHVTIVVKKKDAIKVYDPLTNYKFVARGQLVVQETSRAKKLLTKNINFDGPVSEKQAKKFKDIFTFEHTMLACEVAPIPGKYPGPKVFASVEKKLTQFWQQNILSSFAMGKSFTIADNHNVCQFGPVGCWTIFEGFFRLVQQGQYQQQGTRHLADLACRLDKESLKDLLKL